MLCLACRDVCTGHLCATCAGSLRDAPDRWIEPGVLVRSGLLHDGPARQLVHRLKYEGIVIAADVLAETMAPLVDRATALVPIPRTIVRRHRYGIDPGVALAEAIGRRTGIPMLRALKPAFLGRKHAGVMKEARVQPQYSLACRVPSGAVLIDDVVTTGITISAAADMTGLSVAATATSRVLSTAVAS